MKTLAKVVPGLTVATLLYASGALAARPAVAPAHGAVYVLDCAGVLHSVSTTGRAGRSIDLHAKTPMVPRGNGTGGEVDGCATNGAVYDAASGSLYTLAPATASLNAEAKQGFRLLRFHMPDAAFTGAVAVPGTFDAAPLLERTPDGQLQIVAGDQAWTWNGNTLAQTSPPDWLGATVANGFAHVSLSGYKVSQGVPPQVAVSPVQVSGPTVLVRYAQPGKGFAYAVMSPAKRSFTALDLPFATTPEYLQLAPGGGAVLAQEAAMHGSSPAATSTGKLALLSTADGKVLRAWVEPLLAGHAPVGITPAEGVVFFSRGGYRLASLRMTFPQVPVWALDRASQASLFMVP